MHNIIKAIILLSSLIVFSSCYSEVDEEDTLLSDNVEINETTIDINGTVNNTIYNIHATVHGLVENSELLLEEHNDIFMLNRDGNFTIESSMQDYYLSVLSQPLNTICTSFNGHGELSSNIDNVSISCEESLENGIKLELDGSDYNTSNAGLFSIPLQESFPEPFYMIRDIDEDITLSGFFIERNISNDVTGKLQDLNNYLISIIDVSLINQIDTIYHHETNTTTSSEYYLHLNNSIRVMELVNIYTSSYFKLNYGYVQKNMATSSYSALKEATFRVGITSKKINDNKIAYIFLIHNGENEESLVQSFAKLISPTNITVR